MCNEMKFFIYLLENYAQSRNTTANKILNELEQKNKTQYVYDMYEQYHSESIQNAYNDIDRILSA